MGSARGKMARPSKTNGPYVGIVFADSTIFTSQNNPLLVYAVAFENALYNSRKGGASEGLETLHSLGP